MDPVHHGGRTWQNSRLQEQEAEAPQHSGPGTQDGERLTASDPLPPATVLTLKAPLPYKTPPQVDGQPFKAWTSRRQFRHNP